MAASLQWAIIRKHNAFLVKNRLGARNLFSTEPNNLTNEHAFKWSGLVNSKTVGVSSPDGKGIVVSIRTKQAFKPKTAHHTVKLAYPGRRSLRTVAALAEGGQPDHRADLKRAALARASALLAAQKTKKAKVRKGRKTAAAAAKA